MTKEKSKRFHGRSFTSFIIVFSFLIMSLSGIFLYFAPPGRVAHWSRWTFLALTKEQWQAVHTILSLVFVIAAIFHIYFNWSILIGYIKKKLQQGINKKRELIWSSILIVVLTVFTVAEIPPFSTVMDWGEDLSNSWSNEQTEPPIPHAELMTLEELAKAVNLPLGQILQNLQNSGIKIENNSVIVKDIADKYNITPQELFEKMNLQNKSKDSLDHNIGSGVGSGYGMKTVAEICEVFGVEIQKGLDRLTEEGIEAKAGDKIKDIAIENNILPIDVVNIISSQNL